MEDSVLLEEAIKAAERIRDGEDKALVLRTIAFSYVRLGDKEKARALLPDAIKAARISAEPDRSRVLSNTVESYAELGATMKDSAMILEREEERRVGRKSR